MTKLVTLFLGGRWLKGAAFLGSCLSTENFAQLLRVDRYFYFEKKY